jgi:hypothetical protein
MIIRGIFSAAISFTNFTKILNWFTPSHMPMLMNISLSLLQNNLDRNSYEILPETDLKTICALLGLMNDLLDNQTGRLRFDIWNINGLVLWKEF